MINEANEPSSACRLWRISQVETSTPPSSGTVISSPELTAWSSAARPHECALSEGVCHPDQTPGFSGFFLCRNRFWTLLSSPVAASEVILHPTLTGAMAYPLLKTACESTSIRCTLSALAPRGRGGNVGVSELRKHARSCRCNGRCLARGLANPSSIGSCFPADVPPSALPVFTREPRGIESPAGPMPELRFRQRAVRPAQRRLG